MSNVSSIHFHTKRMYIHVSYTAFSYGSLLISSGIFRDKRKYCACDLKCRYCVFTFGEMQQRCPINGCVNLGCGHFTYVELATFLTPKWNIVLLHVARHIIRKIMKAWAFFWYQNIYFHEVKWELILWIWSSTLFFQRILNFTPQLLHTVFQICSSLLHYFVPFFCV